MFFHSHDNPLISIRYKIFETIKDFFYSAIENNKIFYNLKTKHLYFSSLFSMLISACSKCCFQHIDTYHNFTTVSKFTFVKQQYNKYMRVRHLFLFLNFYTFLLFITVINNIYLLFVQNLSYFL